MSGMSGASGPDRADSPSRGLRFRRVDVRRMPGFRDGGFTVEGLGEGINLVHGPNASGKSTLARAMHALLWPRSAAPARASLAAELDVDGAPWRFDLDGGHLHCRADGIDSTAPAIAPGDTRDRYDLSLAELLALEDGSDLAAVVFRETSGGYDLGRAVDELGFRDRASAPRKLQDEVRRTRAEVRRARSRQESLQEEKARLGALEAELAEAIDARDRLPRIERAMEYRRVVTARDGARAVLDRFPPAMERLTGRELDELAAVARRVEEERERHRTAREARGRARQARSRCDLPSKGVPGDRTRTLDERVRELGAALETWREREREIERLRGEEEVERARIGTSVSDEALAELHTASAEALARLADLAERTERARASLAAADELERWIGGTADPAGLDAKRTAAGRLGEWLSAASRDVAFERRSRRLQVAGAGALVLVGVAAIVVALVSSAGAGTLVVGVLSLALGAGLAALAWMQPPPVDPRAELAARFDETDVAGPERWEPNAVRARVAELEREIAGDALDAERAARWADLAPRRASLEKELEQLRETAATTVAELGLAPDLDHPSFTQLVGRIARWQDATARRAGAERERDEAGRRRDEALAALRTDLRPYAYAEIADLAAATGAVEDLKRRATEWCRATDELDRAERDIEEAERRIEAARAETASVYERAGLRAGAGEGAGAGAGAGDRGEDAAALEGELRQRLEQLAAWREARDAFRHAEREASSREESVDPALRDATEAELDTQRERCSALASRVDDLHEKTAAIRSKLEAAKERHDLEEALAEAEVAADALREARDADVRARAGFEIARAIRQRSRDFERPRVFHRARELFARVTHGRYRLELADHDPQVEPAFRAVDTVLDVAQSLDELSSATRVQLLLSVRVAFIEEQERGPALPILLDETLGNSDDERALAIIDAAIEIARTGRQVFYFTAQADEAAKWIERVESRGDVSLHRVDLAEVRGLSGAPISLSRTVDLPKPRVPSPEGHDRVSYGRALGVPPFDPRRDALGGIHLWHLVDDLAVLHRLLQLGITRWGQLENLLQHGGRELLPRGDAGAIERARAAAAVCEKAARFWTIGRGRPVDRDALAASGAVTDTFLDDVADLAAAEGGDAERLLAALERKRVKRFSTKACEKLREWFLAEKYLDEAEPLSPEEVRGRVLAASASLVRDGLVTPERVDELVAAVPADLVEPIRG